MPHVTFIHGIANKPAEPQLLTIWRNALKSAGLNLATQGVSSSMVYWADVMYKEPDADAAIHENLGTEAVPEQQVEDQSWRDQLQDAEKAFVDRLANRLNFDQNSPTGEDDFTPTETPPEQPGGEAFERIPLPWFVKRRLMKAWLQDVHHYLFNAESTPRDVTYKVQDEIRQRFVQAITTGNGKSGPHIVLSHSMGTVIAYDCLKRVAACEAVNGHMTVGSPLGLDEVQDKLKPDADNATGWSRDDGFTTARAPRWVNVYDKLDPVAGFDAKIANDYKQDGNKVIVDINEQNHGKWRHSIHKYLSQPKLVAALKDMLELN